MYIVHDYKCGSCGTELANEFVRRDKMHEVPCPGCGDNMKILPCSPRIDWDALAKGNNASPEAIRHFERKRAQQKRYEEKHLKEHGDRGKAPGA